jgi:hypothetical protein
LDEAEAKGWIAPGLAKIARVLLQAGLNRLGIQVWVGCKHQACSG